MTGIPGSAYTIFAGKPVGPHDLLLKYTYIGDGNLDGVVSFDDYTGMDTAFFGLVPNLGWATGDINAETPSTSTTTLSSIRPSSKPHHSA